ncbi:MAG: glycine cleavage system protein GcvH, partial [Chloroflexi bacterium]|nr:glycine cleavage system protein GcvH [Chloroflexota bacterium]
MDDRSYRKSHEWVIIDGDVATTGISDFAQEELNDVVYVDLPAAGDVFGLGDAYAVIESVKAASDIYMPMSGEIIEVNEALTEAPQMVNEDPFGKGWLVKLRLSNPEEA